MEKIQKGIYWSVLASELTHVFCCGLPVVVSTLSLMASLGLISVLPTGIMALHDIMHAYEMPMIIASAAVLALGWALHHISERLNCVKDSDCHHEPCAPKKKKASKVLWFATVLFAVNVSVYFGLHYEPSVHEPVLHAHDHAH